MLWRKKDSKLYSVVRPDAVEKAGEGKPHVHPLVLQEGALTDARSMSASTLYDNFRASAARYPENACLGARKWISENEVGEYEWMTYAQVMEQINAVASGLFHIGALAAKKSNVGIYCKNRREWYIAEQACYGRSLVVVPLYDTLGQEAVNHILYQTGMTTVFTSGECAARLMNMLDASRSYLKRLICIDIITDKTRQLATQRGIELVPWEALVERGRAELVADTPPAPEDIATLSYTSGSTGMPKGALLQHFALKSASAAISIMNDPSHERSVFEVTEKSVYLSYLPLAHILERVFMGGMIAAGARIGFSQGSPLKLLDDIHALNPTVFVTVPRLLQRIYDTVLGAVEQKPFIIRGIYRWAYQSKLCRLRRSGKVKHWFWDPLVFHQIRKRTGSSLECIVSGSAPLAPKVMEFARICFSTEVYEGYGQTETCAANTCVTYGDWTVPGHVGAPTTCCEIKLVDIPEMGYTSNDKPHPRGEICIRGPSCFAGYYKDVEKTKETIDADGWVHTGDVGRWDDQGRLYIIDRKKALFKLAHGEYVSPEKVEGILVQSYYIQQAMVYGDSLQNCTLAVIVPNERAILEWAERYSLDHLSLCELFQDVRLKRLIAYEIEGFGKSSKGCLNGFELPRGVLLEHQNMTVENGMLTSTMKIKRAEVARRYKDIYDVMYAMVRANPKMITVTSTSEIKQGPAQ